MTSNTDAGDVPQVRRQPGLPGYKILEEVGSGSVADVWRARGEGREVAVKVLRAEELELEDVQRMSQEVEILKKLRHPCIVRVYGTGVTDEGMPYVVMEWVEGIDLRGGWTRSGGCRRRTPRDIVNQICSALAEGHEHGVIHRDVKPENVLLAAPEHLAVKVVDFGMAKVLTSGAPELTFDSKIFGTPSYMAPERVMGCDVGGAADVYGVAVMAFEMLTGERPFTGVNPVEVMSKQARQPPPALEGFGAAADRVVQAGLAKDPADRPDARAFASELAQALT